MIINKNLITIKNHLKKTHNKQYPKQNTTTKQTTT